MSKVYVGDVGTNLILDCGVDIAAATVRKIMVLKPDATAVEWAAVAEGTTAIKHEAADGDFDMPGVYHVQAYVEMPGWRGRGATAVLVVAENFE